MKEEMIGQYKHAWKMFYKMVEDFDDASRLNTFYTINAISS